MRRRIRRLRFLLWRSRGVDVVVTHAPPMGVGDADDPAHRGFEALLKLLKKYRPQYLLHGHVHLRYGTDQTRERQHGDTTVINCTERYVLELPDRPVKPRHKNQLLWKNGPPRAAEGEEPYGRV